MNQIYQLTPLGFSQSPGEKEVFAALSKLGDHYHIFYSVNWLAEKDYQREKFQGEADFVIFDSCRGALLVIEVKGGSIRYDRGEWFQANRKTGEEKKTYPVKQGSDSMHCLRNEFAKRKERDSNLNYPYIGYAVWFPSEELSKKDLPLDCPSQITLDIKSLVDVDKAISTACDYWQKNLNRHERCFKQSDIKEVLNVIAPVMRAVHPLQYYAHQDRNEQFIRMTSEQSRLIEFLDEQREAVIKGSAGTGKTVLAIEKARRLSESGEAVLFLCVNKALKEHLRNLHWLDNVDFHTFDSLSRLFTDTYDFIKYFDLDFIKYFDLESADLCSPEGYFNIQDYHGTNQFEARKKAFVKWLKDDSAKLDEYPSLQWNYKHLIIDEGQDFQPDWLDALRGRIAGSFYVFCDLKQLVHQNQLDQREQLEKWFSKAQCTFSLSRNCRNTLQIAKIAYNSVNLVLKDQDKLIQGNAVNLYESKKPADTRNFTSKIIEKILEDRILHPEGVVLTMETVKQSILKPSLINIDRNDAHYILSVDKLTMIPFTTVRKFKGLEAEAVILTDVSLTNFLDEDWRHRFYVGCSRAKHELHIIFQDVSEQSINQALKMIAPDTYLDIDSTLENLALLLGGEWRSI